MAKEQFQDQITSALTAIQTLLERSVEIQHEGTQIDTSIYDLEKEHAGTSEDMLHSTRMSNDLAGQRTAMAKERTGLVREQTRLSTKSTELSVIRTDMSRERTGLAEQRNDMAANRTRFSGTRTNLANFRTNLSNIRTSLAQGRNKPGAHTYRPGLFFPCDRFSPLLRHILVVCF